MARKLPQLFVTLMCALSSFGCMQVYKTSVEPYDGYAASERVPVSVYVAYAPGFTDAKWQYSSIGPVLVIGPVLKENTARLAKATFAQMASDRATAQGVLTAKVVGVEQSIPNIGFQPCEMVISMEWELTDRSGKVIWVRTVQGRGIEDWRTNLTVESDTNKRAKRAMDDLFKKTYDEIKSSPEIHRWAAKV